MKFRKNLKLKDIGSLHKKDKADIKGSYTSVRFLLVSS